MTKEAKQSLKYDSAYKKLFSHPEMIKSLILDYVPEEWVNYIDFDSLEKQNGSYVADNLVQRHDDLIWRLKIKDQWCYYPGG
ncbi:MAG: Rpn family recombination-promoting nuclease/putative transposase [Deltaproteobacteria bacterium]|nr:Rpn family recombination-promoting nuclease/putative transposase [Deltaproteobacteria bacterium]